MYDELQLDTLGDKKTALFLIMSDTDSTFNFLISMVYTQLFNLLCDKADDVYGGKLPIAFLNATESTGLQLGLDAYRAPWKIICIRTAFKEYKTYGADLYKEALTMLARGWEGDPDSLRSGILRGMVRFVALYQGEYDPERLVKRLQTIHPMTLVRDEKAMSGTVSYKYMMLILRTYNGASRRFNLPIKQ